MPAFSDQKREEHLEIVRQAMTILPRGGPTKLAELIESSAKIKFDPKYVWKMKSKILAERMKRLNTAAVTQKLAEIEDKTHLIQESLWKILLSSKSSNKDKIGAANAIAKLEHMLLQSQMDAGIFERKLGELEVNHNVKIDDHHKTLVLNAFKNYGLIKELEEVKPKQIDAGTNK